MLLARRQDKSMGRRAEGEGVIDGATLERNLIRLGISETTVKVSEVVAKTGLSRGRVYALFNAMRITPEVVQRIAKGIGVDPSELAKPLEPIPPATPPRRDRGKPPGR